MNIHGHLKSIHACSEARNWARQYETAKEVWDNCTRPSWLLWWIGHSVIPANIALLPVFTKKCSADAAAYAADAAADAADAADAAADAAAADYAAAAADAANSAAAADYAAAANSAADYAAAAADYAANSAADYAAARTYKKQQYCDLIRSMLKQPWIEPLEKTV